MLVNALSVVKSFYFYMKFSRLIQITKQKKSNKNRRLFPIHSHFRKYSLLHFMKKAGAPLVKTITSLLHIGESLLTSLFTFFLIEAVAVYMS